jgi:hypothetical protein
MFWRSLTALIAAAAVMLMAALSSPLAAQQTADPDLQLWNDVDLTVHLNKQFSLNAVGTLRVEDHITKAESYRFLVGITYKPTRSISLAPFTMFASVRNSAGQYRYEYRTGLKIGYRFPISAVSLSHTSRFEQRSRPGRNSWRYRPSVTLKRGLPDSFLKGSSVWVKEEAFYDSIPGRFSRNRLSGGLEKVVNKKLAIDLYYLYQGDNFSHPASAHVLGANWKISL